MIPYQIGQLERLKKLDVSNNGLSGSIPDDLSRFDYEMFAGNDGLCGPPVNSKCGQLNNKNLATNIAARVLGATASLFLGFAIRWWFFLRADRRKSKGYGDEGGGGEDRSNWIDKLRAYRLVQSIGHGISSIIFKWKVVTFSLKVLKSSAAKVSVPGNHPISNEGEAKGSSVLGDGACMGKVQGNDVSGGPKNPYHRSLLSADKGGTARAHNSFPGPNLEDIAHNIIGLKSRKGPRVGLSEEDPFHIDRFINASFPAVPDSSRCSTENVGGGDSNGVAIPDLNTSMEESIRARMPDGSPNPVADRNEGYSRAGDRAIFIRQEIEETIKLGKELGIEMENNVDQVRAAIMGELEEEVAQ
ncbi:hypothetical protein L1987_34893 [Smallanthus sonchifolius]|uniref:Uncharacterized protein n=1 Tax=Smallanthus sonchifolius TaxID=185202 RepID=A0ACB9HV38_9ASTR|nr:hypothetical protein L1987_34893 [Smallanthus sonchifolius]